MNRSWSRPACQIERNREQTFTHQVLSSARRQPIQRFGRLAETVGLPVVVAPMAKGVLAEDYACYAGTLDMACNAVMWDFLKGCDLVANRKSLVVGARTDPAQYIRQF